MTIQKAVLSVTFSQLKILRALESVFNLHGILPPPTPIFRTVLFICLARHFNMVENYLSMSVAAFILQKELKTSTETMCPAKV